MLRFLQLCPARCVVLVGALLLLTGCGLASEPPIVSTAPLPTITPTAPPDLGRPPERVNVVRGAAIFVDGQGCAQCHGFGGRWDGPSAAGFTCKPMLADVDSRGKSILAWFGITSNGNNGLPSCLMPPWRNRLNEQQRWDVVSYAYALRYTPETLTRGRQIWAQECAACHGERGAGDGPQAREAGRAVPDFTDPAYLIGKSDTQLWSALTNGIQGYAAHGFADKLSEDDRWAVVAWLRAQTWDGVEMLVETRAEIAMPVATEEAAEAVLTATPAATVPETPFTLRGTLSAGTAGMDLPANQAVILRIVETGMAGPREVARREATAAADGTYRFADVPRRAGYIYVVQASYAGVLQFSRPISAAAVTGDAFDLPLTLYETTSEFSAIRVEIQRLFVDYLSGSRVQVIQAMRFRNVSDRIVVTDQRTESGERTALYIDLPPGANNIALSPDLTSQFVVSGDGSPAPLIQGVIPVMPGQAPVLQFSYELAFSGDVIISALNRYRVDALVVNVPQAANARLDDPRFVRDEPVTLETGVYDTYALRDPLPPNAGLRVAVLTGAAESGPQAATFVALFATLLILAGTVFTIWQLNRRDRDEAKPTAVEAIVRAIAVLDEQVERGKLDPEQAAQYEAERARLKAELAKLLGSGKDQGKR